MIPNTGSEIIDKSEAGSQLPGPIPATDGPSSGLTTGCGAGRSLGAGIKPLCEDSEGINFIVRPNWGSSLVCKKSKNNFWDCTLRKGNGLREKERPEIIDVLRWQLDKKM